MEILVGGDLVPTMSNNSLFCSGDVTTLFGEELISLWNFADFRIFNLEVPITDKEDRIPKCGPNFMASVNTMKGIKALNPSLLTLANNHILDQGYQGLKATQKILKEYEIEYVGVGDHVTEASKPYIIDHDGLKIGIYACAEHEFSIATESTPGANPFDPLESLDHIYDLKTRCDYVIVLYHGGKEEYRYPSPNLQKICRKMVQKGADLVICQHSHCIGCFEEYEEATIVYGQGNLLFDDTDSEYWKTSLLIKVVINEESHHIEYIPLVKSEAFVRLAKREEADQIAQEFKERSLKLLQDGFLKQRYLKFASKNNYSYLLNFSGLGKWMSRLDHHLLKGKIIKRMYPSKKLLAILNFIECEAHRELLMTGLKNEVTRVK